jgi:hypothetical protein
MPRTKIEVRPRYILIRFRDDDTISGLTVLYVNRRRFVQVKHDKDDNFFEVTFEDGGTRQFTVKTPSPGTARIVEITEEGSELATDQFNNNAKAARLFASWML